MKITKHINYTLELSDPEMDQIKEALRTAPRGSTTRYATMLSELAYGSEKVVPF